MTRTLARFVPVLLGSTLVLAAAAQASSSSTLVKVHFSGASFNGYFEYDSALAGTDGNFVFTGTGYTHIICYALTQSGTCTEYASKKCEPYKITTNGNGYQTFELKVTAPISPATPIVIVLPFPSSGMAPLSATQLPTSCDDFPNPPLPGSTFSINGGTPMLITAISCPPQIVQGPPSGGGWSPGPVYGPGQGGACGCVLTKAHGSYCAPSAPSSTFYACTPRQACCLARLFGRRSFRADRH